MKQIKLVKIAFAGLAALALSALACDGDDGASAGGSGGGSGMTMGFAQVGAESAWRTANTNDIKAEADERGVDLQFSDAQQKQDNQIKAIQNFITRGVDVIAFAPVITTGWDPILREAKSAGIPVIITDRRIETEDDSLYQCFIGANFVKEGELAGEQMIALTGGNATIVELEGTPGSDPAIQRKQGFNNAISGESGMKVIRSQTGEFTRAKGREVMQAFLDSPEGDSITALFAHNDDMALGAIQAIEAAGKVPGKDIIIVSIDGVKGALEAIVEGKLNASVECSPLLADELFDAAEKIVAGENTDREIIMQPVVFDSSNAEAALPDRKY